MEPTVTQEWMDQPSVSPSNQLKASTTVTDDGISMMTLMNEAASTGYAKIVLFVVAVKGRLS